MGRRTASLIVGILLLAPVPAAAAQGAGRCYPPPCAVEAPVLSVPSGLPGVASSGTGLAEDGRSPVPVVAAGLLAVLGSLTAVGLRRRSHILRRSSASARVTASPAAGAPSPPEPQPALP